MKLTTILVLCLIIQVSAKSYAQKITLIEKNAPLNKVFDKISEQTGYDFLISTENLRHARLVTIDAINEELKTALDKIFAGQPLMFEIQDKTVVVSAKQSSSENPKPATPIKVTGRVADTTGKPMHGATIKNLTDKRTYLADTQGSFSFIGQNGDQIAVSFIGFKPFNFVVTNDIAFQSIVLHEISGKLQEINVVNTGYQSLPKERATGSFTQIDNELINRSVSTGILDRLNGVTSSLIFNNNGAHQFGQANIEIRGRATLFSNPNPLIVIDNFAYDGDINNINPNDVESITILKDAAAASAWGSRSGNGVIVITTKKGKLNSATSVHASMYATVGEKPDLYYAPQLSSADYIGIEQFLFNKGAYNTNINNGYSALSPAVQIFLARRNGTITAADSLAQINVLKGYDARQQQLQYFYRNSINQQCQASISGGSTTQKYFVSGGYDRNLSNAVGNISERATLNASNTYYFLKNDLELYTNLVYAGTHSSSGATFQALFPYDQVADANGNSIAVANTLRLSYAGTAGNGKLLNWLYKPLDELDNGYGTSNTSLNDLRLNLSLGYNIIKGLKASVLYSYEKSTTESKRLNELQSYYTRNLINTYTQINATTGAVAYPVPLGGILTGGQTDLNSNNGRFQLNYQKLFDRHEINLLAGTEIKDYDSFNSNYSLYGYDPETQTNLNSAVNFNASFPNFYNTSTSRITPNTAQTELVNRFFSEYLNGSYAYDDRYIVSLSARRDESNLFGVSANQKGVPLWSAGFAWAVSRESFYKVEWMPQLKARLTFGYTGTVNTSISAYLTATSVTGSQVYNTTESQVVNPPNPSLRWEKDGNFDIGLDFEGKGKRISGSIDFWRKAGTDLIGNSPIAPQTGISLYTGNSASTLTNGIDLQINTINLNGAFKWNTIWLYNFQHSRVTAYNVSDGTNLNIVSSNYNNPLVGYSYYAIFSFHYAGLNSTGDPQGYLNGNITTDYTGILNATNPAELVYNGSAVPTSFGSLRNTFSYRHLELSFNVTYKFGYYFRRISLNNNTIYATGGGNYQIADFANRWQKPGDEAKTNVPALIYPANLQRTNLYTYSDALVEKGDHIRLQDLRIAFQFTNVGKIFRSLTVFGYANNIAILWRANHYHLDPDYPVGGVPMQRTYSIGLKTDL